MTNDNNLSLSQTHCFVDNLLAWCYAFTYRYFVHIIVKLTDSELSILAIMILKIHTTKAQVYLYPDVGYTIGEDRWLIEKDQESGAVAQR